MPGEARTADDIVGFPDEAHVGDLDLGLPFHGWLPSSIR
jgi:hypothetical protein